jgi:hypothetical protein
LLIFAREYDSQTQALLSKPRRLLVALVLAAAIAAGLGVWLVGRGDGPAAAAVPKDDPVVFLRGIVTGIARNEYGRIWPALHPAQQRVATRGFYVRCEEGDPVVGQLDAIEVVRALDQRIAVPGAGDGLVDSKAVTFRLRLTDATGETSGLVTAHAVAVDGHWRWILTRSRFDVYRSGSCPVTAPPAAGA